MSRVGRMAMRYNTLAVLVCKVCGERFAVKLCPLSTAVGISPLYLGASAHFLYLGDLREKERGREGDGVREKRRGRTCGLSVFSMPRRLVFRARRRGFA